MRRPPTERRGRRKPGLPDSNGGSFLVVVWSLEHGTAQPQPTACCRGPVGRDPQPLSPSDSDHPAAIQCTPTLPCVTFRITLSKGTRVWQSRASHSLGARAWQTGPFWQRPTQPGVAGCCSGTQLQPPVCEPSPAPSPFSLDGHGERRDSTHGAVRALPGLRGLLGPAR